MGQIDDPPSLHRYLYGYANPLRYIDPTGHAAVRANTDSSAPGAPKPWELKFSETAATPGPQTDTPSWGDVLREKSRAFIQWGKSFFVSEDGPSSGDPTETPETQAAVNSLSDPAAQIAALQERTARTLEAGETLGKAGTVAGEAYLEVAAGDIGDFTAAATGTTVTGQRLTPKERAIATVLAVVPFVAASWVRGGERVTETVQDQRILRSGEMRTLDLSGDWRAAKFAGDEQGVVYVLRDAQTGELLKVGKTEVSNFTDRFRFYERAAGDTGRRLEVDVITVPKDPDRTAQSVEKEIRSHLEAQGQSLPWDQTNRRLGRPGPGVPGTRPSRRLRGQGYEWSGEELVKDPKR